MDALLLTKRIVLMALVGAVPIFVSVASAGSGGHSSGGHSSGGSSSSGGGHSSTGSSGGHSSTGSNGGHSSTGSSIGHSSTGSNDGHSSTGSSSGHPSTGSTGSHTSSFSKGGNPSDPSSGSGGVAGGHSVSHGSVHSGVRGRPVSIGESRHFDTGYGHGDWQAGEETVDWRRHHPHLLHGFIWL